MKDAWLVIENGVVMTSTRRFSENVRSFFRHALIARSLRQIPFGFCATDLAIGAWKKTVQNLTNDVSPLSLPKIIPRSKERADETELHKHKCILQLIADSVSKR